MCTNPPDELVKVKKGYYKVVEKQKFKSATMKDIVILIRIILGFIGILMMANEQPSIKDQNWLVNLIGLVLLILVSINFKFYNKIK